MTTITKLGDNRYIITVPVSKYTNGQVSDQTLVWIAPPKMNEEEIQKEVQEQAKIFEKITYGEYGILGKMTLREFTEIWFRDYVDVNLKESTRQRYRCLYERVDQYLGDIALNEITPIKLLSFYRQLAYPGMKDKVKYKAKVNLRNEIKDRGYTLTWVGDHVSIGYDTLANACAGKNIEEKSAKAIAAFLLKDVDELFEAIGDRDVLSGTTIYRYHQLLSIIFATAVRWQALAENPTKRIDPPKKHKSEIKPLEMDDLRRLLVALEKESLVHQTMINLMVYTGMRRGELFGLEWKDIDFKNQVIHICRNSICATNLGVITTTPKTETSVRTIKIPSVCARLLRELQIDQMRRKLKYGNQWTKEIDIGGGRMVPNDRVFTREKGEVQNPQALTTWFHLFGEKNGFDIHVHTLRHTNASLLISAGVDVRTVAGRLGHAKPATTLSVYSHFYQAMDRGANETLVSMIDGDGTWRETQDSAAARIINFS